LGSKKSTNHPLGFGIDIPSETVFPETAPHENSINYIFNGKAPVSGNSYY
jgi:hypothetical protein